MILALRDFDNECVVTGGQIVNRNEWEVLIFQSATDISW
jgi:hypothetical protein